jgi:hypothetical protein
LRADDDAETAQPRARGFCIERPLRRLLQHILERTQFLLDFVVLPAIAFLQFAGKILMVALRPRQIVFREFVELGQQRLLDLRPFDLNDVLHVLFSNSERTFAPARSDHGDAMAKATPCK